MDDGFGPPTAEDIRLEGHLKLTTGDGTELAVVDVDQLLRGILCKNNPEGIDERFAGHFFNMIVQPIRCRLQEYAQSLKLKQPANAFYGRIDAFVASRGFLSWYDKPHGGLDPQMAHRIQQALMNRHNQQLEID